MTCCVGPWKVMWSKNRGGAGLAASGIVLEVGGLRMEVNQRSLSAVVLESALAGTQWR